MAAGVTLKKDALGAFRAFLDDALAASVGVARRDSALSIDGAVSAVASIFHLPICCREAGPYGAGNPEPLLVLPAHTITYADPVGESHVRARFRSGDGKFVNAIAFRAMGQPLGELCSTIAAAYCMRLVTSPLIAGRGRARAIAACRRRAWLSTRGRIPPD
jgi:single-stranded-DNA-specific exonuclease